MLVESIINETVIRVPNSINFEYIQDFIDYLSIKSIVSKSKASDVEIELIAEEAHADWWMKNKSNFLK